MSETILMTKQQKKHPVKNKKDEKNTKDGIDNPVEKESALENESWFGSKVGYKAMQVAASLAIKKTD